MKIDAYVSDWSKNETAVTQQANKTNQSDEELQEACKAFESYFIEQMFKEMRETLPESELIEKSQGEEIFEDMLYQEYANVASEGEGIGLAQMLYQQLSKVNPLL